LRPEVVDIVEQTMICPVNPWPENPRLEQAGHFMLNNVCDVFRGAAWKVFKQMGMSPDEIEQLVIDAKTDAMNPVYRWFLPL
jgi:hypothetical protein